MSDNNDATSFTTKRAPKKGRWIIALLAAMIMLLGWGTWKWYGATRTFSRGFAPAEMAAALPAENTVYGTLGGMPVAIPSHFANYVEYDGDPGWGERHAGPRPARTPQSPLRSFGFDMRYPDMAGLSSPELLKDKRSYHTRNSPWLSVSVRTGEAYPGEGFADRWAEATLATLPGANPVYRYEQLASHEFGLEAYSPPGNDPKTGQPYRRHDDASDLFILRGPDNRVLTFIRCTNRNAPTGGGTCKQTTTLGTIANAELTIQYRRSLLPEWRGIEDAARQRIAGFKLEHAMR